MFSALDLHIYFVFFIFLKETSQNEQQMHECESANMGSSMQELS